MHVQVFSDILSAPRDEFETSLSPLAYLTRQLYGLFVIGCPNVHSGFRPGDFERSSTNGADIHFDSR